MTTPKCYAIVPAAGRSRRMGTSKLLLAWPTAGGESGTVIDSLLAAWTSSLVTQTVVVVRRDDVELQAACRNWPVRLLLPDDDPADMKASIQCGLRFLAEAQRPAENDRVFVAPADLPTLATKVIDELISKSADSKEILVPQYAAKQSHPILIPWSVTNEIFALAEDQGIDQIVNQQQKTIVKFDEDLKAHDIDTHEHYVELKKRAEQK